MNKIIIPTGYMGSGSSAVTDLVAEFKNCKNELIRDKLLKIFNAVNQGLFIAESNDDGQNAKNGFQQIIRRSEL